MGPQNTNIVISGKKKNKALYFCEIKYGLSPAVFKIFVTLSFRTKAIRKHSLALVHNVTKENSLILITKISTFIYIHKKMVCLFYVACYCG